MIIHQKFTGGNIRIEKMEGNTVYLNNELRDTYKDWFYWAFCIEGAQGETVKFVFPERRIGYYGPAVSHDLEKWEWLGKGKEKDSFEYTFKKDENKVYFAHSMLYHPERFYQLAKNKNLEIKELCKTKKGRSVPYVSFGEGERIILMTARHHACESTGNYVMEGVIEGLLKKPVHDTRVVCVPFVDFDGVVDGDQGKMRAPYDHNRDYNIDSVLYPEVKAIRELAKDGVFYGFDFHSPAHCGDEHDYAFVVQKRPEKLLEYQKFGKLLEASLTEKSLKYSTENDYPPLTGWNLPDSPCFGWYMNVVANAKIAFTLETTYFGKEDNIFSQENSVELGRCFAQAMRRYSEE